jgi:hypothetical protein
MAAWTDFQGTESSLHCERTLATMALAALIAITLVAQSYAADLTVEWTAPGGDGVSGRAARYDLRWSRQFITDASFTQANPVASAPAPSAPGTLEACTISGLDVGVTYYFAIKAADAAGNWSAMSNVLSGEIPEVGRDTVVMVAVFAPPWPNPAREQASFRLALPAAAPVCVEVFDIAGRRVRRLAEAGFEAGITSIPFDLRDTAGARLERGVYLVRARVGSEVFKQRLVIVK